MHAAAYREHEGSKRQTGPKAPTSNRDSVSW
jgi:hypothetical protein